MITLPYFTNVNGTAFFLANDSIHGKELWKSDGTPAGTTMVKDINTGTANGVDAGNVNYGFAYVNVNGVFFFAANNGSAGVELWKSDGTEAGTVMVKDIRTGASNSSPYYLTNVNGTLFFQANNGTNGIELWKSDGTEAGTVLVKDINPGAGGSMTSNMTFLNVNGTLYFSADNGVNGEELWKSDGTTNGTVMIKDIRPGTRIVIVSV
jgi:ELWxxDGT repeat protein